MNLNNYSDAELEKELKQRKKNKLFTDINIVSSPDINNIKELVESIIEDYKKYGYSKDAEHYTYSAVLETFYGENVWKWIESIEKYHQRKK